MLCGLKYSTTDAPLKRFTTTVKVINDSPLIISQNEIRLVLEKIKHFAK